MWVRIDKGLEKQLQNAAEECGIPVDEFLPDVRPADPQFGDFQANGILSYAKSHAINPRKLAEQIVEKLKIYENFIDKIEVSIAGPGFINFKLSNEFLTEWLNLYKSIDDYKSDISNDLNGKKIILDYSSPNTAKQMHVGHLRSMNIGNAIYRILKFCGAEVIRDNHIGDWGTQFGILIMAIKRKALIAQTLSLEEIESLYQYGVALIKTDETAIVDARRELVNLQNDDPENLKIWESINKISLSSFEEIYNEMGVNFDHVLGESFYRDKVSRVYQELTDKNIAIEDDGALCVFHKNHDRFNNQPFIIRKTDGASNYAATDLATVIYRTEMFNADEIIYLTDGRQQDHFQQLFLTVDAWYPAFRRKRPVMKHMWFGSILGEDGKAIKTRAGTPVKLKDLLAEAKSHALDIVNKKSPNLPETDKQHIARVLGIDSVKYIDLLSNRTNDYVFSWEKMLSFDGNTAAYLLYTIARINSILKKTDVELETILADQLETAEERAVVRKLTFFPIILSQAAKDLHPHYICTYLFELAGECSAFYNANRIIGEAKEVACRRLTIMIRSLTTLKIGMNLLGLEILEKM